MWEVAVAVSESYKLLDGALLILMMEMCGRRCFWVLLDNPTCTLLEAYRR